MVQYNCSKSCDYGIDDNRAHVSQGGARFEQKWKKPGIPNNQQVELKFSGDYTKSACLLSIYYYQDKLIAPPNQNYTIKLPENQTWYPAVCLEDPNAWVKIICHW